MGGSGGDNYAYDPYTFECADGYYLAYTGTDGGMFYKQYSSDGGY